MVAASRTREAPAPATGRTIDSAHHPIARRLADVLRSRSERPRIFVLDDTENIEQAVACGIELDSLYATESAMARGLPSPTGGDPRLPFHVLSDTVARSLFGEQKQSRVFALAHAPRPPRLDDVTGARGDIIVLDGVRLVGNIGAITRTARALGAAGIVLVDSGLRTTLDRRLIRGSRGLVFAMPVVLASRTECTAFIRQENVAVAVLSAHAIEPLSSIRSVEEPLALVLGGERGGVSPELDALATYRCAIPMASDVESLNVSVTAAIALYEHRTATA